jgi:hypothetical protein
MAYAYNSSISEAKGGGLWYVVYPGLHSETMSQKVNG